MKKKILSMVMAAAMVLSVSSVSQAAPTDETLTQGDDGSYKAGEITVNGTYEAPTITVNIDTAAKPVVINPYSLETSNSTFTSLDADSKKEQLISLVDKIENKSSVMLAVNATVSASLPEGSKAKIATAPVVPATEKANSVFAYLNVVKGSLTTPVTKMLTADEDNAYNAKATNQVAFTSKSTTKKGLVTLEPSTGTNKVAYYKILGTVAANPTTPWTAADKVNFSIIFDFEPRIATE